LKECIEVKFHNILFLHKRVPNSLFSLQAPATLDGKSFSQYEAVFLQLADEHRTVNAFELQELLDACLPNGKYYEVLTSSMSFYFLK
jgi:hypothetical protein